MQLVDLFFIQNGAITIIDCNRVDLLDAKINWQSMAVNKSFVRNQITTDFRCYDTVTSVPLSSRVTDMDDVAFLNHRLAQYKVLTVDLYLNHRVSHATRLSTHPIFQGFTG